MSKRWQKVEIAYLSKHAGKKSLGELAERFHTDEQTVQAKLDEMKGGGKQAAASAPDAVEHYEKALQAMYAQEWSKAIELFESVSAEAVGELAARAQQFASTARQRLAEAPPEDPWLRAVYEKNRGRYAEALQVCSDGGRSGSDARFAYLAAVLHTLQGDADAGRRHPFAAYRIGRAAGRARRYREAGKPESGQLDAGDALDTRERRRLRRKARAEPLDGAGRPLDLDQDAALVVQHVPRELELPCEPVHVWAEADALNRALNSDAIAAHSHLPTGSARTADGRR